MAESPNRDIFEPEAYELLKSAVHPGHLTNAATVSAAISLKRIADMMSSGEFFTQPVNQYGESFTDAIQNGIERGQRGINTNDR